MKWTVEFKNKKVLKNYKKLPERIRKTLNFLIKEIELKGPVRGEWPNYSALDGNRHHCHLKKGGCPTYVAVWDVIDKKVRLVEVSYVGTHEKAPY